jgi:hypothetical protein
MVQTGSYLVHTLLVNSEVSSGYMGVMFKSCVCSVCF